MQEVADNNCVYRNEIHHSVGERTQVLQDVAADPTLPRTKSVRCTQCNHGEAVFFQVYFLSFFLFRKYAFYISKKMTLALLLGLNDIACNIIWFSYYHMTSFWGASTCYLSL